MSEFKKQLESFKKDYAPKEAAWLKKEKGRMDKIRKEFYKLPIEKRTVKAYKGIIKKVDSTKGSGSRSTTKFASPRGGGGGIPTGGRGSTYPFKK
jgi:hypothetical protein